VRPVTLGVLVCDSVKPELQAIAGDYREMFEQLFRDHSPDGFHVNLRHYDVRIGQYPQQLDECDGYLTTGSAASVNDDEPWIDALIRFIRRLQDEQVKLFAVCFGHQLLAKALGGRVAIADQGWGVGMHEATVSQQEPWMSPAADSYRLISSHKEQVVELPSGAVVLASTPHCPHAMIRCGSLIGVQGHPEFRAPYAEALMGTRPAIIPEQTRKEATESFRVGKPDHSLLTAWIVNSVVLGESSS
jgi:GMP synthase-like glutamine amidotransferase